MILRKREEQFIVICKEDWRNTPKFQKFCTYSDCKDCNLWPYLYRGGVDCFNSDYAMVSGGVYVLLFKEEETVLTE